MESWKLTWSKLIDLNLTSIETLGGNIPGVYRLSYEAEDGNRYVFYVGKSENIKRRLSDHLSAESNPCVKAFLESKKCFLKYAEISNEDVRNATERQMYDYYLPQCNEVKPEGRSDIDVNLN